MFGRICFAKISQWIQKEGYHVKSIAVAAQSHTDVGRELVDGDALVNVDDVLALWVDLCGVI